MYATSMPAQWFESPSTSMFLRESGAQISTLDGNIALASEVLRMSLPDSVSPKFLRTNLAVFLQSALLPMKFQVLDETYLWGYRRAISDPTHAAKLGIDKATLEVLEREELCKGVVAETSGKNWRIRMNLISPQGGVISWDITGKMEPFVIEQFNTRIRHQNGSLKPALGSIWPQRLPLDLEGAEPK